MSASDLESSLNSSRGGRSQAPGQKPPRREKSRTPRGSESPIRSDRSERSERSERSQRSERGGSGERAPRRRGASSEPEDVQLQEGGSPRTGGIRERLEARREEANLKKDENEAPPPQRRPVKGPPPPMPAPVRATLSRDPEKPEMKPVLVPIMVALELEDREAFTGNFRRLEEVFYELPRNEAGFITVRQFAGALRDLNVFLTEKQAHGVFGAFDVDGTGMIDPQLFVKQVAFAAQNHFRTPPRARPPVAPVPVVAPSSVSMRMPPPVTLEEVEDLANQLEDKSAEAYALETQVKELQEALADRDCSIEQVEDKLRLLAQKEESKKGKVKKSDPETNELRYKIRQLEAQVKGLQEEVEDITGMR